MSNTKMLIDATHPEETRVVVQRNGRVEEFDFESAARKLLRGNIYLAKVTRVEPSPSTKFIPTIIKFRSPTGRRCLRKKPLPKPNSRLLPTAAPRRWLAEPPQEVGRATASPGKRRVARISPTCL